ncbi:MAG: M20 family metallopeptidase [Clostridia bacterium]|nr:M20 family metallopeptidase [Clostridia bacterium]
MDIKNLCNLIENKKDELFELLCSLIRINSESFVTHGNEENLAKYIYTICNDLGLETDMFSPLDIDGFEEHPDYLPGRGLENRKNVVARWKGAEDVDSLMLMAHEDTVAIGDLKNWEFDPLAGIIKDGKIYGRGACDDKYAIATALFVIKLLKDEGFVPKQNVVFAAYSDEEYGGSHGALASVLKYPCKKIVSMDGREGQIWHCGSGGQEVKYYYHTQNTVDSAALTAKAIPVILECIESFADARRKELEENPFYKGTIIPSTSLRYMDIHAGKNGSDLGCGEVKFVYYTDKTKEEIYAEFAEIEKLLAQKLAPMGIIGDGFKPDTRFFHYVYCQPDSEDVKIMVEASKEATGKDLIVCGSCLSDLSVISKYGSSAAFGFGCGRDFSKNGGAHQPNEFIECDALLEYAKTIAAYIIKQLS